MMKNPPVMLAGLPSENKKPTTKTTPTAHATPVIKTTSNKMWYNR